jgi:sensor histidine kinase YesM
VQQVQKNMPKLTTTKLPAEVIQAERLKGARMSVYFRWIFIILLLLTTSLQLFSGFKSESIHALVLIGIYLICNIGLSIAVRKKYDPIYLGYLSAIIDLGIITFHLYYLTSQFDFIAITAAATILLYPIMFVLYTFRLNRPLLIFMIFFTLILFNANYFHAYSQHELLYIDYLSTSPLSHIFKSVYLLFIGFLCIYLQHSMETFIAKQVAEASAKIKLHAQVKLEEQKNKYAQKLIEKEKIMNVKLEQEVQKQTEELTLANTQVLKLQKENLQSQFEVLKQQVNPHFLFNSLNVLTSLIKADPDLAETFTEKLSKVYRYVLENKEKDLVSLSTEMDFLKAYLFLINIRFSGKIHVKIDIDNQYVEYKVLPIAVQMLIENAIKHNTYSKAQPLNIIISVDENHNLIVSNNLKMRETIMASTGVGLENISRRYALISDKTPSFKKTEEYFIAKLPLLKI